MSALENFDLEKFTPGCNMYIEASAGTGKTYTIQKLVSRLVSEGFKLEEILLVTYTEKATGELRERIRSELEASLKHYAQAGAADKSERFESALYLIDHAPIYTIHSFCQKSLRDFAFEAGEPFAPEMVGDEAVGDFIDLKMRDEWVCDREFLKLIEESDDVGDIQGRIKAYLQSAIGNYFEGVSVIAPDLSLIRPYFHARNFDELMKVPAFAEALENLQQAGYKKFDEFKDALKKWNGGNSLYNGTKHQVWRHKGPGEYFKRLNAAFKERTSARIQDFISKRIISLAAEWKKYKSEHALQSYSDMIDSVREQLNSPDGSFCASLRARYRYAVIDEFQDTNERQWDIFKKLFLDGPHNNLIVVGDPKQSIYSFQGADVTVYRRATAQIGRGYRLATNYRSTGDMIRACNRLFTLKSGNQAVFDFGGGEGEGFPESLVPATEKPAPRFDGRALRPLQISEPVTPAEYARLAADLIIQYASESSPGSRETRLQIFDESSERSAAFRSVRLSDFALLARTSSEMELFQKELSARGVPYLRYKDNKLFFSRECLEWIALFQALAAPDFTGNNIRFLREALVTDFFGVELKDVDDERYQKGCCRERGLLQKWQLFIAKHQYAQFLEDVYASSAAMAKLSTPRTMQEYARLTQIGDYAIEYLYNHRASLDQLVLHLRALAHSEGAAEDENGSLVARSTDFDCVQIMTIHASKGLEFPIVISVAGHKKRYAANDGKSTFLYHSPRGIALGVDDNAKECRKNEEMQEYERLHYVDYTRASSLMVLPRYGIVDKKTGEMKINYAAGFEFLGMAFGNLSALGNYAQEVKKFAAHPQWRGFAAIDSAAADEEGPAILRLQAKAAGAAKRMHSYSSLTHGIESAALSELTAQGRALGGNNGSEAPAPAALGIDVKCRVFQNFDAACAGDDGAKDYPAGAAVGNVLHDTLEVLLLGAGEYPLALFSRPCEEVQKDAGLRELLRSKFEEWGFYGERRLDSWLDHSILLVWSALNGAMQEPWSQSTFCLKDLPGAAMKPEMEFYLDAFGITRESNSRDFCKGFMDLVFKRDGRYYILDWKSDKLQSYSGAAIRERVDEAYSIQRVLYSYCLVQWLKTFHRHESRSQIFDNYFGGIYYVFLRGTRANSPGGIYAQTWEKYDDLALAYARVLEKISSASGLKQNAGVAGDAI